MSTLTVLYPQGTKFDMDYYKATHMPLVMKSWGPHGLKSYQITQMPPDAAFCVQATLQFDSLKDLQAATSAAVSKEVFEDVNKFSDKSPTVLGGEVAFTN